MVSDGPDMTAVVVCYRQPAFFYVFYGILSEVFQVPDVKGFKSNEKMGCPRQSQLFQQFPVFGHIYGNLYRVIELQVTFDDLIQDGDKMLSPEHQVVREKKEKPVFKRAAVSLNMSQLIDEIFRTS